MSSVMSIQTSFKVSNNWNNIITFIESVIAYQCFYTGLNLIKEVQKSSAGLESTSKTSIINSFCNTFGAGYEERKDLLSEIY